MSELERSAWDLVAEAEKDVESITVEDLRGELDRDERKDGTNGNRTGTVVLDIRDIRELWTEGSIPDAEHAPRGMIEFWADPDAGYYKDFFDPENRYVLYCNEAGRSALAAKRLAGMGYGDVAHLEGGFSAWQEAGGEIVDVPQKEYKDR